MTLHLRRRRGQGMTEYILIVGLIAILLVAAISMFRDADEKAYQAGVDSIDSQITSPITGWYDVDGCPYRWNQETGNWHDPGNNLAMVSDSAVSAYTDPHQFER